MANTLHCLRCGGTVDIPDEKLGQLRALLANVNGIRRLKNITLNFDYCGRCRTKNDLRFPKITASQATLHAIQ
jgi:Fe2+ or Zn2+ uptake regulation protein